MRSRHSGGGRVRWRWTGCPKLWVGNSRGGGLTMRIHGHMEVSYWVLSSSYVMSLFIFPAGFKCSHWVCHSNFRQNSVSASLQRALHFRRCSFGSPQVHCPSDPGAMITFVAGGTLKPIGCHILSHSTRMFLRKGKLSKNPMLSILWLIEDFWSFAWPHVDCFALLTHCSVLHSPYYIFIHRPGWTRHQTGGQARQAWERSVLQAWWRRLGWCLMSGGSWNWILTSAWTSRTCCWYEFSWDAGLKWMFLTQLDYSASAFLVCISYHCFPLVLANSAVWCSDSIIWCSGHYSLCWLCWRN